MASTSNQLNKFGVFGMASTSHQLKKALEDRYLAATLALGTGEALSQPAGAKPDRPDTQNQRADPDSRLGITPGRSNLTLAYNQGLPSGRSLRPGALGCSTTWRHPRPRVEESPTRRGCPF